MNVPLNIVPQGRDEPTILVNIESDDPTRGDVAGWRGLARVMAKKVGGRVVYADDKLLRSTFPDAPEDTSYEALLARFLKPYNPPEYVFGHRCSEALKLVGQDYGDAFAVTQINESIARDMLGEHELVAHHLTPEMMTEEGALFDAQHPNIKTPIISVMLVDPYDDYVGRFAKKITRVMEHYPEASVYLCASRRTKAENYDALFDAIKTQLSKEGLEDQIDLLGYKFDRDAPYNPYKGLIARAQHIVVWGNSQSMVSEALYGGKTVYLHRGSRCAELEKQGYTLSFNALSKNESPVYKEFEPVNLAERIAEALLERRQCDDKQNKKSLKATLKIENEDWLEILDRIRMNFHRAEDLPKSYKNNPEFVRLAVQIRGFAIQYFPKFKGLPEFTQIAVKQNHEVFHLLDQAAKDDAETAYHAVKRSWKIIKVLSPKLRANDEIAYEAINQSGSAIFALDAKYLKDKKAILLSMEHDDGALEHIDKNLFKDRDFVKELVSVNWGTMRYLHEHYPNYIEDLEVAETAAQSSPYALEFISPVFTDDEAFMRDAITAHAEAYKFASDRLKADANLALLALKGQPYLYNEVVPTLKQDQKFVRKALGISGQIYNYLSDELQQQREMAVLAVRNGMAYPLERLHDVFYDDVEMVIEIVKHHEVDSYNLGEKARNNLEIMMKCVVDEPLCISDAGPDVINNKDFVITALGAGWGCIEHVPKALLKDRDVAMAAVKSGGRALQYIDLQFLHDKELVMIAVENDPAAYLCLVRAAAQAADGAAKGGAVIASLKTLWKGANDNDSPLGLHLDHDVALAALKSDISLFSHMGALQQDPAFRQKVFNHNPDARAYLNGDIAYGGGVMG
tara:strand:+ start:174532 stop:177090 length:2559 start_codon:yes stop_codon:yes gene_type:complete